MNEQIREVEKQIMSLNEKLVSLRKKARPTQIENYTFKDINGEVSLLDLFAGKEKLFVIHNMGQGCRYCTLWADGLNGFVQHLEDKFSLVLVSKDSVEVQRRIANSRGWRFRMASHLGGKYIKEQSTEPGAKNQPGIVCYQRKGKKIFKMNSSSFGPGDLYCPQWHILSLGGISPEEWTPQFNYWQRPTKMDDGGDNIL